MAALLQVLIAGLLAQSPQSPQAQTPAYTTNVTVVMVDVTVLDRDGKPVPGLKAGDFEVKLNGHVQPVRVVIYETTEPEAAPPAPVAGTPAPAPEPAGDPRVFVVLIDDLSMAATHGKRMLLAADRFIAGLPASDLVGFTTSSGAEAMNPTRNHDAVRKAVRHVVGEFNDPRLLPPDRDVGIAEAVEILDGDDTVLEGVLARNCGGVQGGGFQQFVASTCGEEVMRKARFVGEQSKRTADRQVAAYLDVVKAMGEAPGIKSLVLLSEGLAVPSRRGADLDPIARAAATAGVQFSVLSDEPDQDMGATNSATSRADEWSLRSNIQTVADMTGGLFFRVVGSPDSFFHRVEQASSGIYRLGIEAPADDSTGGDFKLEVRATRSGVTVHANRHALAAPPAPEKPLKDRLHDAVADGTPLYGVPVDVSATVAPAAARPDGRDLDIAVRIPASVPGPVTIVFGLVDASGVRQSGDTTVDVPAGGADYRVPLTLAVAPGTYKLRFAAGDGAGRIGTSETTVTIGG